MKLRYCELSMKNIRAGNGKRSWMEWANEEGWEMKMVEK